MDLQSPAHLLSSTAEEGHRGGFGFLTSFRRCSDPTTSEGGRWPQASVSAGLGNWEGVVRLAAVRADRRLKGL